MAEEPRGMVGAAEAPRGDPEVVKALGLGKAKRPRRFARALIVGLGAVVVVGRGITVVMVTHEPDMAVYASRIITFRDGRIERDEHVKTQGYR